MKKYLLIFVSLFLLAACQPIEEVQTKEEKKIEKDEVTKEPKKEEKTEEIKKEKEKRR